MTIATGTTPRVLQLGFTTADSDRSVDFYSRYLGFSPIQTQLLEGGPYGTLLGLPQGRFRLVKLHLGEECLELTQVLDPGPGRRTGEAIAADSRSCDLWFQHLCLVTGDLDAALQRLKPALELGLATPISRAPQTLPSWNRAAAGIRAFKFRDPEGHNLELLQFPADKGDPRWHHGAGLLGIDHSAISISDSARSARFYDDLLGMRLGGDGINSGPTQDALDNLEQTEVRITAHRCNEGAGIECLDYQAPNRGRPMPADLSAADLAHWQIRLQVDDLDALVERVEIFGGSIVGAGALELGAQQQAVGARRALQVADPDGHRLQLVEA